MKGLDDAACEELLRLIGMLLRSDDDLIELFPARTGAAKDFSPELLRWGREHIIGMLLAVQTSDPLAWETLRRLVDAHQASPDDGEDSDAASGPAEPSCAPSVAVEPIPEPSQSDEPEPIEEDDGLAAPVSLAAPVNAVPPALVVSAPQASAKSSPWVTERSSSPAPSLSVSSAPTAPASQPEPSLDATSELDPAMFARLAAPTPFRGEAAPPPPSAPVPESIDFAGETAAFDPAMFAHLSDPTPFEAPAPERDEMGETAALDPAMFAHLVDPMPFQEGSAVLPSSAVDRSEGSELAGGTATIDPASIAGVLAAYPVRTAPLPMPVENYAALVARSEGASEAERAELHRAYGVADAAHRKRIDQEFSEAFARDATLRQQFVEHLRQGRDWLRRQRGGT